MAVVSKTVEPPTARDPALRVRRGHRRESVGPFRFVLLADRQRRQPSKLNRRVRFPQGTSTMMRWHIRGSANGRPPGFESGYGGSIPSPRTRRDFTPGQLLLVVAPGSEPGGRWFDSNSRSFVNMNGSDPAG